VRQGCPLWKCQRLPERSTCRSSARQGFVGSSPLARDGEQSGLSYRDKDQQFSRTLPPRCRSGRAQGKTCGGRIEGNVAVKDCGPIPQAIPFADTRGRLQDFGTFAAVSR
jgi:hypothetical protein